MHPLARLISGPIFLTARIGDLLDLGVDLATVQKVAGHASASTTAGYDRRDRGVQRRAAVLPHVPYTIPED
ncbi:MAG: hypothetical protein M3256_22490 [Actinomycetota bacterium]|nr:hypothetical protein [Candidatus Dormibacteraeota bacterium]MDQ6922330.1 hypothetical protein [Candidatus Dormibacteraeota bacterium]MDQ6948950.1 hypothetical protein [Actinomycetota bacterium]